MSNNHNMRPVYGGPRHGVSAAGLGKAGLGKARRGKGAMRTTKEFGMTNDFRQRSEAVGKAVDQLTAATGHYARGDTVPYDYILRVTGIPARDEGIWHQTIKRWRDNLLNCRGIALRAVPSVGYRLLTEEEQAVVQVPRERLRRAASQFRRGLKEMEHCTDATLTDRQNMARRAMTDSMHAMASKARSTQIGQTKTLAAMNNNMPLRPMPKTG